MWKGILKSLKKNQISRMFDRTPTTPPSSRTSTFCTFSFFGLLKIGFKGVILPSLCCHLLLLCCVRREGPRFLYIQCKFIHIILHTHTMLLCFYNIYDLMSELYPNHQTEKNCKSEKPRTINSTRTGAEDKSLGPANRTA